MKTAAKRERSKQKEAGGKQVPGTRNDLQCLRDRSRGCSKKRSARSVSGQSYDQQCACNFFARMARSGNKAFNSQGSQKENCKQSPTDHPAQGNPGQRSAGMKHSIEIEIADRLNHSRKNKSESKDQGRAIMRSTKANECIRCVAKAQQRTSDFEIQIGLRSPGVVDTAHVQNRAQIGKQKKGDGSYESCGWPLPKNPNDFGPISHEIPQMR